jgi:RNA polymerase-binding protein DksA
VAKQASKKSRAILTKKPPIRAGASKKTASAPRATAAAPAKAPVKSNPSRPASAPAKSSVARKTLMTRPAPQERTRSEPVRSETGRSETGRNQTGRSGNDHQQVRLPLTSIPTNGKPRKNQAGLNTRELEHFRDLLLAKRREIVGDMGQMEREALHSTSGSNLSNLPLHMADMGTDNYEQEFTLGLVEKDRNLLREINSALAKIMDGSYGICEGTGKPISKVRLEAQPWARFSIEHARQMERGFIR